MMMVIACARAKCGAASVSRLAFNSVIQSVATASASCLSRLAGPSSRVRTVAPLSVSNERADSRRNFATGGGCSNPGGCACATSAANLEPAPQQQPQTQQPTTTASASAESQSSVAAATPSPSAAAQTPPKKKVMCDRFEQGGNPLDTLTVTNAIKFTTRGGPSVWSYDEQRRVLTGTFCFRLSAEEEMNAQRRKRRFEGLNGSFAFVASVQTMCGNRGHWCYNINIIPRSSTVKIELKTLQLQGISYEDLMLASLLDSLALSPAPAPASAPAARAPTPPS